MEKGWSGPLGRAAHYYEQRKGPRVGLCGAPIRLTRDNLRLLAADAGHRRSAMARRLLALEVCDHCQAARRRRRRGRR